MRDLMIPATTIVAMRRISTRQARWPLVATFGPVLLLLVAAVPGRACFSIVVGKQASADGHVLVAHNEDDTAPQIVRHHKVPRRDHPPGAKVRLRGGGELDQVRETWAYLWSEMPGMLFSDSYVNEWGVCVTSDSCPSREDRPEISDGGIGYMLRRLIAERARTAREGVVLAGELVERFGYLGSGRTYLVGDPDEAWVFCAVHGKHWLARRVGDDQVAMVANVYTVRRVDPADKHNVLASRDIVSYAIARGWYDPQQDGPFDFAAAYAHPAAVANPVNFGRQSTGLNYLAVATLPSGPDLPFSIGPKQKLGVADLMRILRHNEQTTAARGADGRAIGCETGCAICRGSTQTSFVARLRTEPSPEVGIVYWTCLGQPATSIFVPFHFGIASFPAGFAGDSQRPSAAGFDAKLSAPFVPDPSQAFWTFSNFRDKLQRMPDGAKKHFLRAAEALEAKAGRLQGPVEEAACRLAAKDPAAAGQLLSTFSGGVYLSALDTMSKVLTTVPNQPGSRSR